MGCLATDAVTVICSAALRGLRRLSEERMRTHFSCYFRICTLAYCLHVRSHDQTGRLLRNPTAHSTRKWRVKTPMPVDRKPRQKMEVE